METKGVWAISAAILLVLVLSSEQATSSFDVTCFYSCNSNCLQRQPKQKHECRKECWRECGGIGNSNSQMHHCNLSCSINQCAQFGQDAEAVENCLDNCKKHKCDDAEP